MEKYNIWWNKLSSRISVSGICIDKKEEEKVLYVWERGYKDKNGERAYITILYRIMRYYQHKWRNALRINEGFSWVPAREWK
jgi:hypothetical protein